MSSCCPRLNETVTTFEKPQRKVSVVFVHCSAASRADIDAAEINQWHLANGWSCIGYHYFVKTDGTIQYGRDIERTPAAQSGYNTASIAICANGLHKSDFTEAQFKSIRWLCQQIDGAYGGDMRFRGHCEVAAKGCPVYDYAAVLGLNEAGYMVEGGGALPPPVATIPMVTVTSNFAQVGLGDTHPHVGWVQSLLGLGTVDGIFGQMTDSAVKSFQQREGLTPDGIVGKATWQRLLDVGT